MAGSAAYRQPILPWWALGASGAVLAGGVLSWAYHLRTYDVLGDATLVVHGLLGAVGLAGVVVAAVVLGVGRFGARGVEAR